MKRFSAAVIMGAAVMLGGCEAMQVGPAVSPSSITGELCAGQTVVLADGTYTDVDLKIAGNGREGAPITVRAEHAGKVVFTRKSAITLAGDYQVLSGILLLNCTAETDGISVAGNHCRLTECAVVGGTPKFLVHLRGRNERMDHCFLAEKVSGEPTFQIEAEPGGANDDLVDHNHFGHRGPLGRNGGETMRVGYSGQSMNVSRAVVEENLFDRCDGEIEIISSKSCENVYRHNTFLDCAGMLTLRHGNRCVIDSNYFNAHGKKGSGGIRVIGEDHVITNNHIESVAQGAFWITSGIQDSPLKGYFTAKRTMIAGNSVIDCPGPAIDLNAGYKTANRTLMPEDITFARNLFIIPKDGKLTQGVEGKNYVWEKNSAIYERAPATRPAELSSVMAAGEMPRVFTALHVLRASEVGPGWLSAEGREELGRRAMPAPPRMVVRTTTRPTTGPASTEPSK